MAEIDADWTPKDTPDDADTYPLTARDDPYLIRIAGQYVKVKVKPGRGPIILQPDYLPFRRSATRPRANG